MDKQRFLTKKFLIGLFVLVSFLVISFLIFAKQAKTIVTNRIVARQQILSKTHSGNISSFFEDFSRSMSILSQSKTIRGTNSEAQNYLNIFIDEWRHSGIVSGIVITDVKGNIVLNSNILGRQDTGKYIGDREYFVKAGRVKIGDVIVGEPVVSRIGASEGNMILPVAVPIYKDNAFSGALVSSVEIHKLVDRYLNLIESPNDNSFLIDKNGKLIFSSKYTEVSGKNISDFLKSSNLEDETRLKSFFEKLKDSTASNKIITDDYIVVSMPVVVGNNNWFLVLVSPTTEVKEFAIPIYIRLLALIIVISSTMIVFGVFTFKNLGVNLK